MPRRFVKRIAQWMDARRGRWYLRMFGARVFDPLLWSLNRHSITAAFGAGLSHTVLLSYLPAFFAAGILCIIAAILTLAISRQPKAVPASVAA